MSHNPYFNRWFSAITDKLFIAVHLTSHNPYFNRWFSAIKCIKKCVTISNVTILILIDGFLQFITI